MPRLYKIEKLCSETAISGLFCHNDPSVKTALAFPLRVAWKVNEVREVKCPRFLISVPKKKLRHAVDRVRMRRVIREAYRLNRSIQLPADLPVDIAFIYVGVELIPYARVERAMRRLLKSIAESRTC